MVFIRWHVRASIRMQRKHKRQELLLGHLRWALPPMWRSSEQPKTTAEANVKEIICYHCGRKGHYVGKCHLIGQSQTNAGKLAWAKKNKDQDKDYEYNRNYY